MKIIKRNVIDKEWMFMSRTAGTLKRVRVPSEKRGSPSVTDSTLKALATTVLGKFKGCHRQRQGYRICRKSRHYPHTPVTPYNGRGQ
ncbi:MAG: hypothetical protein CM1200mP39_04260 [Dehalococcoidia bacterium]|nr:MAG: hypothetical protein CM1200mP39_04260 [Dehalococcoidia bacterium]